MDNLFTLVKSPIPTLNIDLTPRYTQSKELAKKAYDLGDNKTLVKLSQIDANHDIEMCKVQAYTNIETAKLCIQNQEIKRKYSASNNRASIERARYLKLEMQERAKRDCLHMQIAMLSLCVTMTIGIAFIAPLGIALGLGIGAAGVLSCIIASCYRSL